MTTDKTVYSPGEKVNFTMTNTGEEPLTFPNSALGLMIRNLLTNESYPIYSAQVITTLNPNESSSVIWDQESSNGSPVPLGDYIGSIRSGSASTDVTFSIIRQMPWEDLLGMGSTELTLFDVTDCKERALFGESLTKWPWALNVHYERLWQQVLVDPHNDSPRVHANESFFYEILTPLRDLECLITTRYKAWMQQLYKVNSKV